ncbi:MAG: sensor histidine kinase [Pseudomonadota bacterium]
MGGILSLRVRLTGIILIPLVIIGCVIGAWAVHDAQDRADDRFNRALLSAALAVSRDVAVSEGDALSPQTNDLLLDSFGGVVFYHVYAPDGAFVTGYATPPVPMGDAQPNGPGQAYFEGFHQARPVRALRFVDTMSIDGLAGDFTVTIWQDAAHRNALVRDLVQNTLLVILILVVTVALVVWFGVRQGLRPLNSLEDAIARRSSDDLRAIKRGVPSEVTGIVTTLNDLFAQLARSITAQMDFLSNAAHQLKNPIAGVLALAEAVDAAPNEQETKKRARDLLAAARETSELSEKLLLMERAKTISPASMRTPIDLSESLTRWLADFEPALPGNVRLAARIEEELRINGDEIMIREALLNLLHNALIHGGKKLSAISVVLSGHGEMVSLEVSDDGRGIAQSDLARAATRFEQVGPAQGTGLGLSIVGAVAQSHGGRFKLASRGQGLEATLTLPKAP